MVSNERGANVQEPSLISLFPACNVYSLVILEGPMGGAVYLWVKRGTPQPLSLYAD